jgi:hypothetical protein
VRFHRVTARAKRSDAIRVRLGLDRRRAHCSHWTGSGTNACLDPYADGGCISSAAASRCFGVDAVVEDAASCSTACWSRDSLLLPLALEGRQACGFLISSLPNVPHCSRAFRVSRKSIAHIPDQPFTCSFDAHASVNASLSLRRVCPLTSLTLARASDHQHGAARPAASPSRPKHQHGR